MPIKFQCPHCKKAIVAQDAQAGMQKACPGCKKSLFIPLPTAGPRKPPRPAAQPRVEARPKPPVDIEAEAAALLSDTPSAAPAGPAITIDFTCPQCDTELHLPLDLAGKKTSCPACTRIISVPQPSSEAARNWRQKQEALPSLAKQPDLPAPEGAWGSTEAAGVSREALVEANVIRKKPKPRTLTQKYFLPVMAGCLLLGGGVGAWVISNRREESRELAVLQEALEYAASPEAKQKTVPAARSALFLAAGDYQRSSGKADAAVRAREQYTQANNLLATGSEQDTERIAALLDVAVAEIELGGEDNEVEKGARLRWDEIHKSLRGILTAVRAGDTAQGDGKMFVLRGVARRLIAHGQAERALTLVRQLYGGSDEFSEATAAVGLECLAAGDEKHAREAKNHALAPYTNPARASSRPPLRASVVALAQALGEKTPEGTKAIGEDIQILLGQVEGLARKGDWARAREKARPEHIAPVNRFRAEAALAMVAVEKGTGGVEALGDAVDFLAANVHAAADLNWLLLRLAEVAIEAGVGADRLDKLIAAIPDPRLRGRAQFLRLRAQAQQGTVPTEEAINAIPDSVGRLMAWQLLARASTRRDPAWAKSVLDWEQPRRAFASAGIALGLQDHDHGK
jgi:hypothetical protein